MWGQLCGAATAIGMCVCMSGCGLWVSKKQSLDTSFALGATSERDVHVRPAPVYERSIPRDGLILPELYFEDEDIDGDTVSLRRDRAVFLANVHNELVSLQRDLLLAASRADQKGAAGWAAFDPKVREFGTGQKLIQRYLLQAPRADVADWLALKTKINTQLDLLRAVIIEAQQNLEQVREPGHYISSNPLSNHPSLW